MFHLKKEEQANLLVHFTCLYLNYFKINDLLHFLTLYINLWLHMGGMMPLTCDFVHEILCTMFYGIENNPENVYCSKLVSLHSMREKTLMTTFLV